METGISFVFKELTEKGSGETSEKVRDKMAGLYAGVLPNVSPVIRDGETKY